MHLVIGTPCYGGMMCTEYTQSLLALKEACIQYGIKMTCVFLGNESLVQRGRNTIAHHFMSMPDATHLIFIDADQKFVPNDIAKMMKADKGIIGGPVPMKGINWERVRKGANDNYINLSKLTGIFNLNELPGHKMTDANKPFQVKHIGTGFMLIRRDVFETIQPHVGWYTNGGSTTIPGEKVYDYFKVQNVDHELLSEDYNFCHLYRKHGGTVWAAPWCELGHFGAYLFSGQYAQGAEHGTSSDQVQAEPRRHSA
jgi:hypothetical protein